MNASTKLKLVALIIAAILVTLSMLFKQARIWFLDGDFHKIDSMEIGNGDVHFVSINDTLWNQMKKYGEIVSSRSSETTVYFILAKSKKDRNKISNLDILSLIKNSMAEFTRDRYGKVSFHKSLLNEK